MIIHCVDFEDSYTFISESVICEIVFRSICRNAGISREQIIDYAQNLPEGALPLEHEAEYKLAKTILKFSDCILTVLDTLFLHQVHILFLFYLPLP